MTHIVSLFSYRGGTGRSTTAVNVARLLAADGARVAVVDTALQYPALHTLFGINDLPDWISFTDYLLGRCTLGDVVQAVPLREAEPTAGEGTLFALPACNRPDKIEGIQSQGYDVGLLGEAFKELSESLALDWLFLDTSAGMTNETAVALAASETVLTLARADQVDLVSAPTAAGMVRRLSRARTLLALSAAGPDDRVPTEEFARAYEMPVVAVLPAAPAVAEVSGRSLFVEAYPEHRLTARYRDLADALAGADR
ncbi:MinD/ParA family ATP-binding protein [Actinospica robiniae]|uniref:MinD/ParA family ATP-binding protein n=1 Tax=Actinospica robiniae TaxID=304901 RepID=UPI00040F8B38|nr:ParA family protein [Actinospica robiniae]